MFGNTADERNFTLKTSRIANVCRRIRMGLQFPIPVDSCKFSLTVFRAFAIGFYNLPTLAECAVRRAAYTFAHIFPWRFKKVILKRWQMITSYYRQIIKLLKCISCISKFNWQFTVFFIILRRQQSLRGTLQYLQVNLIYLYTLSFLLDPLLRPGQVQGGNQHPQSEWPSAIDRRPSGLSNGIMPTSPSRDPSRGSPGVAFSSGVFEKNFKRDLKNYLHICELQ